VYAVVCCTARRSRRDPDGLHTDSVRVVVYCSAATDIVLKGAEWPLADFEDSGGITSGSWSKLSPGATVREEYFLTPKTSGYYAPLAATVTYKAEAGAKTQVSTWNIASKKCKVFICS